MSDFDRISKQLKYDPVTGQVKWLIAKAGVYKGMPAGRKNVNGYIQITVDQKIYPITHIIWLLHTGSWPKGIVHHKDGIRHNNWFDNLEDVTYSGNNYERWKNPTSNISGVKGITRDNQNNRWRVVKAGKYIGVFKTLDEAKRAHEEANV